MQQSPKHNTLTHEYIPNLHRQFQIYILILSSNAHLKHPVPGLNSLLQKSFKSSYTYIKDKFPFIYTS